MSYDSIEFAVGVLFGADSGRRIVSNLLRTAGIALDGQKACDIQVHDERFFHRQFSRTRPCSIGDIAHYGLGAWSCNSIPASGRGTKSELH